MSLVGRLLVAVSSTERARLECIVAEMTAGAWAKHIVFVDLIDDDEQNIANNGTVGHLAQNQGERVLAAAHLTSKSIGRTYSNVKRLKKWGLREEVAQWMEKNHLTWRGRVEAYRKAGPFRSISPDEWCQQFHRVNPNLGLRVGAAVLAQFKMLGPAEFADWFDGLPKVDASYFFVGSDPHSGDHGIINSLSARISGGSLHDAKNLQKLTRQQQVRLFSDAGWSGGESKRRLECLYTACSSKANALCATSYVNLRFGYLTDSAETVLKKHLSDLVERRLVCDSNRVTFSCPTDNFLKVKGSTNLQKGLAFQDQSYLDYVDKNDPFAMRDLCSLIGKQIAPDQPLGTSEIASTIAFQHSLPKAMLPVLIIGEGVVTASDGSTFVWKPLLHSKHLTAPAPDVAGYHCAECPLEDRRESPRGKVD